MKILVIDDDYVTRLLLQEILASKGYDVVVAEDGEGGLSKARTERPSLVITDVLMPGLDGFQFLREAQKDSYLAGVPVIFYTGSYLDRKDEELARELGVARYPIKPVMPEILLATVQEVLEEKGPSDKRTAEPRQLEEPVFLKLYNERLVSKLKSKAIESERARLSLGHIMESIGDGVVVIERDHTILHANTAAGAMLGITRDDMIGRKCHDVIHRQSTPCDNTDHACPHNAVFDRGEIVKVLHTHTDAGGGERYVEITASPVRDGAGEIFAMVETHRDSMEKQRDDELVRLVKNLNEAQTNLKHMAVTDELTDLKNRRYIMERLEEEFQRAKRSARSLGLIMLDIDHFKEVNDVYGHIVGDAVLRTISGRIRDSLRKHDLVGRVGGEEFLVVCPESGLEETVQVAERIRRVVHAKAIGEGTVEVLVALSAGVTVQGKGDKSADMLFSRADTALYRAKDQGRNRVVTMT